MKIVITTGGTGGHIYPALSLADAIMDYTKDSEILFIGTANHMEARLVPENGYNIRTIKAAGFNGSIFNKLKSGFIMLSSISDAKKIIKEFQADVVIGFGGYVSAPVILAAKSLHVPIVIHEQNSFAGRANLFLQRWADRIVVCYENVRSQFSKPTVLLGNPRTYTAMQHKVTKDLFETYGLEKGKKTVLIVMGSQGSESVNRVMIDALKEYDGKDYQILYVTGRAHYQNVVQNNFPENVHIIDYCDQVGLLNDIDLLVTRGGATTASEIGVFGVASLIIPSPYVPNNHQEFNAQALVDVGGAIMLKEKDLSIDSLVFGVDELMKKDDLRNEMAVNSKKIGFPNAAYDIIQLMKELVHVGK